METNSNFEYKGFKANGFVMMLVSLAVIGLGVWAIVQASMGAGDTYGVVGAITMLLGILSCTGLKVIEPNQARVLVFFGKYKGNLLKDGFWWVNPFMSVKKISLRARNLNPDPIKVNDKTVFNIDAPKPVITMTSPKGHVEIESANASESRMEALANFVAVQSDAALRQVAGNYAYDNTDAAAGELSLRSNADVINEELEQKLSDRFAMAGIEVVEARINYLAYAPEIAAVMLRRQQADAIISAREMIVEGAVSMVKMAIDQLSEKEIVELDEERKAAMVSNLLVVLCSDESAQPVVNAGTLHH